MRYEYVKEGIEIKDKTDNEKKFELIINIVKTKKDLENARTNYEFAEGNLIDYFLYEMKANQAKLDYLLSQAKECGVEMDLIESFSLKNKNVI